MNEWALQNYFKNLCNSYCVILNELRRLKRETKENNKQYLVKINGEISTWKISKGALRKEITWQIIRLKPRSLIITTEEEILTLIDCYNSNPDLLEERIINTDQRHLQDFPKGKKLYEDFYEYYCEIDKAGMNMLYEQYIECV